jgi:hypothetical protein
MAAGSDNDQVVAGSSESEKSATTFAKWNGTAWSRGQTLQGVAIDHVSCSTTKFCVAVGSSSAIWNGVHWRLVAVPGQTSNPETTASYASISCVPGSRCLAVGSSSSASSVIKWAGNAWHVLAAPRYSATNDLYLNQINCYSASRCLTFDDIPGGQHERAVVSELKGSQWSSAAVSGEQLDGGGVQWTSANSDVVVDLSLNATTTQWLKG